MILYAKGRYLHVADTLSRAHQNDSIEDIDSEEIQLAVHTMISNLPITETRLADIQQTTVQDSQLQQLKCLIEQGRPSNIANVPQDLQQYWKVREDLLTADDLILMANHLVIPVNRQAKVLQSIHEGHLGIKKCKV